MQIISRSINYFHQTNEGGGEDDLIEKAADDVSFRKKKQNAESAATGELNSV